ncbi:MAG: hypothetical protein HJJLKODD_00943 [Phycisphaerae bacterium]|nr:hypothetical protein [Phycisphaerae bacterium]
MRKQLLMMVGVICCGWSAMPLWAQQQADSPAVVADDLENVDKNLPRYREGGTPDDPNQSLFPYALQLRQALKVPTTGLIESPPEYGPTHGVMFRYHSINGYTSVVTACVAALTGNPNHDEIAYVVVSSAAQQTHATNAFIAAGADMSKVVFLIHPSDSVWLRDFGPHFIWQNGTLAIVDSHYYNTRPLDNFIPTLTGDDDFIMPTYDMDLYYSGGNFQPGPGRSGFVTSLITLDNPTSLGFTEDYIRELYDTFQGIDTLHIMPKLPSFVDATGHIDMWMYLVDEDTVILSEFIPGSNPVAISITDNAVSYMQALGFEVYRPKAWNVGSTHYTYTNAFRVNNRIFIPVYGTAILPGGNVAYNDEDAEALAIWQAAAGPGVEIVPIQCNSIIPAAGAIHCIVMQVPRYVEELPAAHIISPAGGEVWLKGSVETIRWNATDNYNVPLPTVNLYYSLNNGQSWTTIATGVPNTGSYDWTLPQGASNLARIKVTAYAADGTPATAISNQYKHQWGIKKVYDFATGAEVDHFAFGTQTNLWSAIDGNPLPVTTPLATASYTALSLSDATGGSTSDPNRYNSPTVSAGYESTHVFEFTITELPSKINEIAVKWEGFADTCMDVELYVWDYAHQNWSNGQGLLGQHRAMDTYAGNRDETLVGYIRSNFADYIDEDGVMTFLVYADRPYNKKTFHDYMSVTVKQIRRPAIWSSVAPYPDKLTPIDIKPVPYWP